MRGKIFFAATCAVCLLLCAGWYLFIHEPTQSEILSMQLETRRLQEIQRELDEFKRRHENLSAFVAEKERQLDAARNFLPATMMQDKFIDELYRAAEFNNVRLISVQADEISDGDEIQTQVITVKSESDYFSLLNFIREILDGGRLVDLENFSVTVSNDGILNCDLRFKIFATGK